MTIGEAREDCVTRLAPKFGQAEAQSITRILFEDFFAYYTTEKDPGDFGVKNQNLLFHFVAKILDDYPVQYLTNTVYFYGKKYYVDASVLIPRSETEELVEWIIETVRPRPEMATLLDIGTGSGCIPIALKLKLPKLHIEAFDISDAALVVASKNAAQLEAAVHFFKSDALSPLALTKQYDVIVSNPPYIAKSEWSKMDASVRLHEPEIALFAAEDQPLQFYDSILKLADHHLKAHGLIFVEINEFLASETLDLFSRKGYTAELRLDLQRKPRMIRATKH